MMTMVLMVDVVDDDEEEDDGGDDANTTVIRDKNDGKLRVIDVITNVEKWQNPECMMMETMAMIMMIMMIMIMYDDG